MKMPKYGERTLQQVFDYVCSSLITQGKQSIHLSGCMYRQDMTPTCPIRCAAGMLIPDDMYYPSMECRGISNVIKGLDVHLTKAFAPVMNVVSGEELPLVVELQASHDTFGGNDSEWLEAFKYCAKDVAVLFDLDPKVIM